MARHIVSSARFSGNLPPMIARDRRRLRITITVILCLFFQQVAVAAYACTMTVVPADMAVMSEGCDAASDSIAPPAPGAPALCAKHCAPDVSVVADHVVAGVPALALPPVEHDLLLMQPTWHASAVSIARSDPPPRLRYCSLLI